MSVPPSSPLPVGYLAHRRSSDNASPATATSSYRSRNSVSTTISPPLVSAPFPSRSCSIAQPTHWVEPAQVQQYDLASGQQLQECNGAGQKGQHQPSQRPLLYPPSQQQTGCSDLSGRREKYQRGSDAEPLLDESTLLAEAAKRAQEAVMIRDMEEMEL